jgi:acetylornithine deacetylase
MPNDSRLGPSTLNIGVIKGGRAPNVIPDDARAEIFYRLVDSGESLMAATEEAVKGLAEAKHVLTIPAVHLETLDGFETAVMAYTTDIPAFQGAWGKPLLIGPGSIHVAHTDQERIPKTEITEAIEIYKQLVRRLIQS